MTKYRFLFHLHTFKSFDATITYHYLYKILEKHNITHLAITEHNNIDSYIEFKTYLENKKSSVQLIPAVEYTTKVGDIIALNIDKIINFSNYLDLIQQIKRMGGIVILPHPFKRKNYPDELYEYLDFYELINMRGVGKTFNPNSFKHIKYIFGADAHNNNELPGIINTFYSENFFEKALLENIIVPELTTEGMKRNRLKNRVISKIRKMIG